METRLVTVAVLSFLPPRKMQRWPSSLPKYTTPSGTAGDEVITTPLGVLITCGGMLAA
jgi:hypothetical protein